MSDEKITLELLGARVLTLTAEVRDLQHRFTAMESRFTALESRVTALEVAVTTRLDALERRFSIQEERMSAMLVVIVRIAERLDRPPDVPLRLKRRHCNGRRDRAAQAAMASASRKNRRFGALRGRLASRS
jgi:hypothetical protein